MQWMSYELPEQMEIVRKCANTDERLIFLCQNLNCVACEILVSIHGLGDQLPHARRNLRDDLATIAAFAFAWLCDYRAPDARDFRELEITERIWEEREHQRRLLRDGKILFACDSTIVDARRKFRVLTEEVGEVANALDRLEANTYRHQLSTLNHHLQCELVQVAAVAIAWLESLESINHPLSTINSSRA